MAELSDQANRDRIASAAAVAAFHALLGYALIAGLGIDVAGKASDTLKLFDISPEAPPLPAEPPPPPAAPAVAPEAAAAPPGFKAEASPIVAPPPQVRVEVPPPLAAAPTLGAGGDTSQGASNRPGSGTGAGGEGSGTGSGGSGSGSGPGGAVTRARQVEGALSGRDYPRAAKRARAAGTVLVRYTVNTDGRVTGCTITQSSGNADLDNVTCRLIERRFRYEPARDAQGRPVPDTLTGRHIWWTEPRRPKYPYEWKPEEEPER
jgi:protein TonB